MDGLGWRSGIHGRMSEFDEALALRRDETGADITLTDGWVVGGPVNGGLLMALAASAGRAAVEAAGGHGDVLALSAHFLSAAQPGPARLTSEVLRTGRSTSTAQVSLTQELPGDEGTAGGADASGGARASGGSSASGGTVERVRVLTTYGDLERQSEPVWRAEQPPAMPGPEQCVRAERASVPAAAQITLIDRLDLRLDPATLGWAVGEPSGRGELRGWVRFADGREPDVEGLVFFLDACPPVTFDLGAAGWAPTIEFTAHVRARPAPGWCQIALRTQNVAGGLLEEDAVIWDSTGRMVAQSRQLAGVRMPSA